MAGSRDDGSPSPSSENHHRSADDGWPAGRATGQGPGMTPMAASKAFSSREFGSPRSRLSPRPAGSKAPRPMLMTGIGIAAMLLLVVPILTVAADAARRRRRRRKWRRRLRWSRRRLWRRPMRRGFARTWWRGLRRRSYRWGLQRSCRGLVAHPWWGLGAFPAAGPARDLGLVHSAGRVLAWSAAERVRP